MNHEALPEISDERFAQLLATSAAYSVVLLRAGPNYGAEGSAPIIREHALRNMALREAGLMPIVCPVTDDTDLCGVAILTGSTDEVDEVMRGDQGVRAGLFVYEIHPIRSFPGSTLP